MVKVYNPNIYYIFSGLLIDSNCGKKLSGDSSKSKHTTTYYYRCITHRLHNLCPCNKSFNETYLEQYLLNNLSKLLNKHFMQLDLIQKSEAKIDNTKRIAEIKAEMKRTTISYNKGRMTEEDHDKEYERLEKELSSLEKVPETKNNTYLKDLTKLDVISMYKELNRENKQAFWRKIIDKIEIDPLHYKEDEKYIRVSFLN